MVSSLEILIWFGTEKSEHFKTNLWVKNKYYDIKLGFIKGAFIDGFKV